VALDRSCRRAIRLLNENKFVVAVVTNQSAIAAGRYSLSDVEALHARVQDALKGCEAHVDFFAVCPHSERDACTCRKPLTGLATQIEEALGQAIDYGKSWTIGDKVSDMEFGRSLGAHTALISSNYWTVKDLPCPPDLTGDSLFECVSEILGLERNETTWQITPEE
jgi:histidinol-phosphate phosphatase family protein